MAPFDGENGEEIFCEALYTGDAFGTLGVLFGVTRIASVRAVVNSDLFRVPSDQLWALMDRFPNMKTQIFVVAETQRDKVRERRKMFKMKKQASQTHGVDLFSVGHV